MADEMIMLPEVTRSVTGGSLLFPVMPGPRETLLSYVVRCLAENHLGNPRNFIKSAGINLVTKGDYLSRMGAALPSLADLLRTPAQRLKPLWGAEPLDDGGKRRLGGVHLRPYLVFQHGRRCLPSLPAGHPDEAIWMVRDLNFCARTWELLVETCPQAGCGKRLTWPSATSLHRCNHCGVPLSKWKARTVPKSDRPALSWLTSLFSEDAFAVSSSLKKVPAFFEIASATDAFELAIAFGQAIHRTAGPNTEWHPSHLATGVRLLLEYPRSVWDLYANETERTIQPAVLAHLYRIGRDHCDTTLSRNVQKLLLAHRRDNRVAATNRVTKTERIRISAAGKILRLGAARVKELVDQGHLPGTRSISDKASVTISVADIENLEERLIESICWDDFRRHYNLPITAVEQLLEAGKLLPSNDPAAQLIHAGRAMLRRSASGLLSDFNALPLAPTDGSFVPLAAAFQGVGGRDKPWAATILAGIGGVLPGGLARVEREKKTQFAVDGRVARAMIMGGPDFCSPYLAQGVGLSGGAREWMEPHEVEAYLNCTAQDVSWLRERKRLTPMISERTRYHRHDIGRLGFELMSSREAAARLGVYPKDIRQILDEYAEVRSIGQGFHPRADLERVLKQIAPDRTWWS